MTMHEIQEGPQQWGKVHGTYLAINPGFAFRHNCAHAIENGMSQGVYVHVDLLTLLPLQDRETAVMQIAMHSTAFEQCLASGMRATKGGEVGHLRNLQDPIAPEGLIF